MTIENVALIVSAYLKRNHVRPADVPSLIADTHAALQGLGKVASTPEAPKLVPPISIRKSLTDDHIVSMEDGRQYRSLKRHLSKRGLTPDAYRAKWGLPSDYPMVAASYSAKRSELAKQTGLGSNGRGNGRGKAASELSERIAKVEAPKVEEAPVAATTPRRAPAKRKPKAKKEAATAE